MGSEYAIELKKVTKKFGQVIANNEVSLSVRKGEIVAILGENGSGKTTLMNMISGIYYPDYGSIYRNGKEVSIRSPKDAFSLGIGMIHQHFKLIDVLTAAENIILGLPGKLHLDMRQVEEEIKGVVKQYGFELDPTQKIYDMSVSQKQTVEIVKVLYRGAQILILDEPTAVLTPQETDQLFHILKTMKKAGKSIIIITHKLNEVLEVSDRVSVLRKGTYIGTVETKEASVESLTEMMVGQRVKLDIERGEQREEEKRVVVSGLTCVNNEGMEVLKDVSFTAYGGEILGIAGISGSGQKELLECIAGLYDSTSGEILYCSEEGNIENIGSMTAAQIQQSNIPIAFVPEDRLGMGLVGGMDLTDNMMIRSYKRGKKALLNRVFPRKLAGKVVEELEVATPSLETPIRRLSGGNVQKVLVGREISSQPKVLLVAYPVRGLDIQSSYTIYHLLNKQKEAGVCVLCVGEDLDVLLALCDRILVLSSGRVTGILEARETTKEEIGLRMSGGRREEERHAQGTDDTN